MNEIVRDGDIYQSVEAIYIHPYNAVPKTVLVEAIKVVDEYVAGRGAFDWKRADECLAGIYDRYLVSTGRPPTEHWWPLSGICRDACLNAETDTHWPAIREQLVQKYKLEV